jgi:hypothetical protein
VSEVRTLIGIDPGPRTSGLVVYELPAGGGHGRVRSCWKEADLDQIRCVLGTAPLGVEVCIECTQAGPPSTAVVKTTEVVGRLMERCEVLGLEYHLYYRREVLQALACARQGNKDSLVRLALIELHGGDKATAVGKKRDPGPLYGLSSHAWQALGVVAAHTLPWTPIHPTDHKGTP